MEEREETQRNRQPQKPVMEKKPRQDKRNKQNGGHSQYVVSGAPWHQQVDTNNTVARHGRVVPVGGGRPRHGRHLPPHQQIPPVHGGSQLLAAAAVLTERLLRRGAGGGGRHGGAGGAAGSVHSPQDRPHVSMLQDSLQRHGTDTHPRGGQHPPPVHCRDRHRPAWHHRQIVLSLVFLSIM